MDRWLSPFPPCRQYMKRCLLTNHCGSSSVTTITLALCAKLMIGIRVECLGRHGGNLDVITSERSGVQVDYNHDT